MSHPAWALNSIRWEKSTINESLVPLVIITLHEGLLITCLSSNMLLGITTKYIFEMQYIMPNQPEGCFVIMDHQINYLHGCTDQSTWARVCYLLSIMISALHHLSTKSHINEVETETQLGFLLTRFYYIWWLVGEASLSSAIFGATILISRSWISCTSRSGGQARSQARRSSPVALLCIRIGKEYHDLIWSTQPLFWDFVVQIRRPSWSTKGYRQEISIQVQHEDPAYSHEAMLVPEACPRWKRQQPGKPGQLIQMIWAQSSNPTSCYDTDKHWEQVVGT